MISEFVAEDEGGNGDHVILGHTGTVPGPSTTPDDEPDPLVSVAVEQAPGVGTDQRLGLVVRDAEDRPVRLDTYLGTYAHVTGFDRETGSMVHMHPLAEPVITEDGSGLTFHAEVEQAGDYRLVRAGPRRRLRAHRPGGPRRADASPDVEAHGGDRVLELALAHAHLNLPRPARGSSTNARHVPAPTLVTGTLPRSRSPERSSTSGGPLGLDRLTVHVLELDQHRVGSTLAR